MTGIILAGRLQFAPKLDRLDADGQQEAVDLGELLQHDRGALRLVLLVAAVVLEPCRQVLGVPRRRRVQRRKH